MFKNKYDIRCKPVKEERERVNKKNKKFLSNITKINKDRF